MNTGELLARETKRVKKEKPRGTQEEPSRISIEIPKKGEDVAAEGEVDTTVAPLTKKKRA
ncbi:hypothetical protein A2U01_0090714, partial [Trifolium medium]|nr:hypothetical protein [Trifolium medium]